MELQMLLEWRAEIEAKTRRLQLEEQLERSWQMQQSWLGGNPQQPWLQDRLGAQPVLWPGQEVPVAYPFQGAPAGWTGPQMGRAQAVQIGPELGHAARLQSEAPRQMLLQTPPGGGLGASGGRHQERGRRAEGMCRTSRAARRLAAGGLGPEGAEPAIAPGRAGAPAFGCAQRAAQATGPGAGPQVPRA